MYEPSALRAILEAIYGGEAGEVEEGLVDVRFLTIRKCPGLGFPISPVSYFGLFVHQAFLCVAR